MGFGEQWRLLQRVKQLFPETSLGSLSWALVPLQFLCTFLNHPFSNFREFSFSNPKSFGSTPQSLFVVVSSANCLIFSIYSEIPATTALPDSQYLFLE
jgi:hypothetical protein